jgi:hypothetical protein
MTLTEAQKKWDAFTEKERVSFLAPFYYFDYLLRPKIFDNIKRKTFNTLDTDDQLRIKMHFESEQ